MQIITAQISEEVFRKSLMWHTLKLPTWTSLDGMQGTLKRSLPEKCLYILNYCVEAGVSCNKGLMWSQYARAPKHGGRRVSEYVPKTKNENG